MAIKFHTFCPLTNQNELNSIPYLYNREEVDRVGFEPTTTDKQAAPLKEPQIHVQVGKSGGILIIGGDNVSNTFIV